MIKESTINSRKKLKFINQMTFLDCNDNIAQNKHQMITCYRLLSICWAKKVKVVNLHKYKN